ncbi:MAG TPA: pyridoxamine 5'-phosphate oxidase family protein [Firmicutes bacterium]|nr:pyridoxamine 5'-phosphate oxidase family protein [Bacillota bacterium]
MFQKMRRNKQALSQDACATILYRCTSGVLALSGDDGYPYAVPISYVYDGEKLYFHSAKSGHKLDAIRRNPKASFCVIDKDQVVPKEYTTYFRSVIVFGIIRVLADEHQKRAAIEKLAWKYAPDDTAEHRQKTIDDEWTSLYMLEMTPKHISGKEAIELVKAGQQVQE